MSADDIAEAVHWSLKLIQLIGIWAAVAVLILVIVACICGFIAMPQTHIFEQEEKKRRITVLNALRAENSILISRLEGLKLQLDQERVS